VEREGVEWVVREGVWQRGKMTQALYAHMNNKKNRNLGVVVIPIIPADTQKAELR
jgi:hypothetical protein